MIWISAVVEDAGTLTDVRPMSDDLEASIRMGHHWQRLEVLKYVGSQEQIVQYSQDPRHLEVG